MERAKTGVVFPCPAQLNAFRHQVDYIDAGFDLINRRHILVANEKAGSAPKKHPCPAELDRQHEDVRVGCFWQAVPAKNSQLPPLIKI